MEKRPPVGTTLWIAEMRRPWEKYLTEKESKT